MSSRPRSPQGPPGRKGPPSLNIRPIPEDVKRTLDMARAAQGLTWLTFLRRLHALHAHMQGEARKRGPVGAAALAALKAAGLRRVGE
jgi:hypothetical protein